MFIPIYFIYILIANIIVFASLMAVFYVDTFSNASFLKLVLYGAINSVWIIALYLIVNFAFGTLIHFVGENSIVNLMQTHLFLQPIITSLVGLIPNCASSILITQLYIKGGIAFGSMFAGLCANAGIGIAIILKTRKNLKNNLLLILLLYIVSVISGIIINLFI